MALRDANLIFSSTAQRPSFTGIAGVNNAFVFGGAIPYWPVPFPDAFASLGGNPKVLDLTTFMDLGKGRPLTMRFFVATTFEGAEANTAAFAVAVSDAADTVTNQVIIVQGPAIATAGLTAGTFVDLVIPPLPSIALASGSTLGKRYVCPLLVGFVPATDWTAGAVEVSLRMSQEGPIAKHTSGFSV